MSIVSIVSGDESIYSHEISRYEKEVRLACETSIHNPSSARQALARSTLDRIQLKLDELKNKTEEMTKNLEEEKIERIEADLTRARQNHALDMRRYRLAVSGETLGQRSPAAIEEELKRVRESDSQVRVLEDKLNKKKMLSAIPTQGAASEKNYQELEVFIKASDRYQSLHSRLTNCAFRQKAEDKSLEEKTVDLKGLKVLKETNELKEFKDPDADYRTGSQ